MTSSAPAALRGLLFIEALSPEQGFFMTYEEMYNGRLRLYSMNVVDAAVTFSHDVQKGLSATPKVLPAKYFYDAYGSRLYEIIYTLPEYYPYRG